MVTLELSDKAPEDALKITKALSTPTRFHIMHVLARGEFDISQIAHRLKLTEANISAQVKHLEKAGLVKSRFDAGEHGIRKICRIGVDTIQIKFGESGKVSIPIVSRE